MYQTAGEGRYSFCASGLLESSGLSYVVVSTIKTPESEATSRKTLLTGIFRSMVLVSKGCSPRQSWSDVNSELTWIM